MAVAVGELPGIKGRLDMGGVTGVCRPADDDDGVGEMAVAKVDTSEGADTGPSSLREMTLTVWGRVKLGWSTDVDEWFADDTREG